MSAHPLRTSPAATINAAIARFISAPRGSLTRGLINRRGLRGSSSASWGAGRTAAAVGRPGVEVGRAADSRAAPARRGPELELGDGGTGRRGPAQLGIDHALELAAVEKDAATFSALVDVDTAALVLTHVSVAFGAGQGAHAWYRFVGAPSMTCEVCFCNPTSLPQDPLAKGMISG